MGKYTTHEKVYLVEKYVKYKHKKCVRKFRLRFPMTPIPSKSSIVKLVKKWRKNGTVLGIGLRPRLRPHVSNKMFLVIKSLLDNEPSISIQDISKVTYLSRQVVKKVKKRIETDSIITHSMSQFKINDGFYKNLGLEDILGNLKRRLGKEYTMDNSVTAESFSHKRHHSRMESKTSEQASVTGADATRRSDHSKQNDVKPLIGTKGPHRSSKMAVECSKTDISSSLLLCDKKHNYTSENIKAEPLSEVFQEETTVIKSEWNTMSPETVVIKTEFPAPWSETHSQYILGD